MLAMPHRIHIINECTTSSKEEVDRKSFFVFLNRWTKKLVLQIWVSKVNKIENRRIKIGFKPKENYSSCFLIFSKKPKSSIYPQQQLLPTVMLFKLVKPN